MTRFKSQIFFGLVAACLPIPMLIELSGYFHFPSVSFMINWYTILLGIPAVLLILGYQIASSNNNLSYSSFTRGSAVIGIALGLLCIIPLALPLIYFRAENETALAQFMILITIFSSIALTSILYGCVFWLVGIKPKNQSIF